MSSVVGAAALGAPSPSTKTCLPWRRFWVPSGSAVNAAYDGFIEDPATDLGRRLMPAAVELRHVEDILVGLEGDAGLGKTESLLQPEFRAA